MMNALPDPVIGFHFQEDVFFANPAAVQFFKAVKGDLKGKSVFDLVGKNNPVGEAVAEAMQKNRNITLNDISIQGRPIGNAVVSTLEHGHMYMLMVHEKPLQNAHEWNDEAKITLRSAEIVSRILTQELKEPTARIAAAAEKLAEKKDLTPEEKELLLLIRKETARIEEAAEPFTVFGDLAPKPESDVNFNDVLQQVRNLIAAEFGDTIQIEQTIDPKTPNIRGDFSQLVQAQLNLVRNAAEALPNRQGKISIRTSYDDVAMPSLPLIIEIEDNGQGITPESLRKIFQPYFTTKPNAKGFGLPVVSKIIDKHGGKIDVKSQPGKTVFRISLPAPINRGGT